MNGDIVISLPPSDPKLTPSSSASSNSGTTTAAASSSPSGNPTNFNLDVQGADTWVAIYLSRVPGELTKGTGLLLPPDSSAQAPSDLWRVSYWLGQNGGLCRQERPWVTADDQTFPVRLRIDTPKEAAALAKKEGKLVFVLHVSGNFEDPRFT